MELGLDWARTVIGPFVAAIVAILVVPRLRVEMAKAARPATLMHIITVAQSPLNELGRLLGEASVGEVERARFQQSFKDLAAAIEAIERCTDVTIGEIVAPFIDALRGLSFWVMALARGQVREGVSPQQAFRDVAGRVAKEIDRSNRAITAIYTPTLLGRLLRIFGMKRYPRLDVSPPVGSK